MKNSRAASTTMNNRTIVAAGLAPDYNSFIQHPYNKDLLLQVSPWQDLSIMTSLELIVPTNTREAPQTPSVPSTETFSLL